MRTFDTSFRIGEREYRVEAHMDDEPSGDVVALEFIGTMRGSPADDWQEVRLLGRLDLERGLVTIDALEQSVDFAAETVIEGGIDATLELVEAVFRIIPPIDPVLGCLLKGATSSVILQTIKCWHGRRDVRPRRAQLQSIGGCLLEHKVDMLKGCALGLGRCLIFG